MVGIGMVVMGKIDIPHTGRPPPPKKNIIMFYLGQKAQTCGNAHPPRRFLEILYLGQKSGLLT